jgi:UDP-N-acetylmuramoyl-L-alanyl-D-glutamate--2,6-diaminopimelate ligase
MRLEGLLLGQTYKVLQGVLNENITGIANDSRKINEGFAFVAIKGFEQDGHLYIGQAIQNGAHTIILEDRDAYGEIPENITVVEVPIGRKALAAMATHFYNNPSKQFKLVGVTGTNGKTSTVFLINNVLEYYNRKTGLIGTILNKIDNKVYDAERTTPESIELKSLFYDLAEANVNDVIIEVSSHALDLYRVAYTSFDVGVFTNLTLDHLDYHKTMDNYKAAKAKLFKMCATGVINIDDEAAEYMMENGTCSTYTTFSTKDPSAVLYGYDIINRLAGVSFKLKYEGKTYDVSMQTPGEFTVYNGMAAIGALLALHVTMEEIIVALEKNSQIKGRFQSIESPTGFTTIVDYAHAPDGLLNVLTSMKGFATKKIITVFGCGGDRDKTKRPIMGEIAGTYSDYCIITSDNPRTEEPATIIDEVEVGIKKTKCDYIKITDRKEGIEKALSIAEPGDLVLIAGKGHEDYQIIGKVKHHFDDVEIVNEFYKGV